MQQGMSGAASSRMGTGEEIQYHFVPDTKTADAIFDISAVFLFN